MEGSEEVPTARGRGDVYAPFRSYSLTRCRCTSHVNSRPAAGTVSEANRPHRGECVM